MGEPDKPHSGATGARRLYRNWPALLLLAGLLCPLVFSTWYTFNEQHTALQRAFELEIQQISDVVANGVREPIWNLTPALGQPVIDTVMRDKRILAVRVTSEAQGVFAEATRPQAGNGDVDRIVKPVMREGIQIGEVTLLVDFAQIDEALAVRWPEIYALGAIQAVLAMGVVVLAYWSLRRREREEALQEMNQRLTSEVQARARDLEAAHAELLRSESLAVLGRLTATVSHELRHPLGTIQMSLSLIGDLLQRDSLANSKDRARVEKAFQRADRNIDRCTRIIEDLLDFTRSDNAGRESISMDDWLRDFLAEFPMPVSVQLRAELHSEATVLCDPERFRRVLINLMTNALQAMTPEARSQPRGELTVISRQRNRRLEVVVRDTGDGIAPELHEKVFEPLFSTRSFGFGLGLPLVRQIMEQHDGGVAINPTDTDTGAEIVAWLPLSNAQKPLGLVLPDTAGEETAAS